MYYFMQGYYPTTEIYKTAVAAINALFETRPAGFVVPNTMRFDIVAIDDKMYISYSASDTEQKRLSIKANIRADGDGWNIANNMTMMMHNSKGLNEVWVPLRDEYRGPSFSKWDEMIWIEKRVGIAI